MTKEQLQRANYLDNKLSELESFNNLNKSTNSKVEITVEGSESNMGSNFTKTISFKWGSTFGEKLRQLINEHQSELRTEFDTL